MKKKLLFIYIGLFILSGCYAQNKNTYFGKYYKIGEYGIQVPFADQPHISPKAENSFGKYLSYQYAYPDNTDDVNLLYGIDVLEIKTDTKLKDLKSKVNYVASVTKIALIENAKGNVIKEEEKKYYNRYCLFQKMKVNIPNIGEIYINSLYIPYNDIYLRIFTFTLINNDDNIKIYDFFKSIKFEEN